MLKRVSATLIALIASVAVACAAGNMTSMTGAGGTKGVVSAGGCSQATTFLARANAVSTLTANETTAYTDFICGAVTAGLITGDLATHGCGDVSTGGGLFDIIKLFATKSAGVAALNICGTSFSTLTNSGATFTQDIGYSGNGTTSFIDSNWNAITNSGTNNCGNGAAACNLAFNDASHFAYDGTSRGTDAFLATLGSGVTATNSTLIIPYPTGGNALTSTQDLAGQAVPLAVTNALGLTVGVRSGGGSEDIYHCDSGGCATANAGNSGNGEPNVNMYYLAINTSGVAGNSTADTVTAVGHGAHPSTAQVALLSSLLNNFNITVGAGHW